MRSVTRLTAGAAPPVWRGHLHTFAFAAALPGLAFLVLGAEGATAAASAAIYASSLIVTFGTSAAYHRLGRSPRLRAVLQRMDHCTIFVLISGTYVPLCMVALPLTWGIPLLSVIGGLSLAGIALKLGAFHRTHTAGHVLYLTLGWAALVALPVLIRHLTATQLALVIGGGVLYTVGVPVLVWRRPDPWPRSFGYHEVWHACTVLAAALHFVAIAGVLR